MENTTTQELTQAMAAERPVPNQAKDENALTMSQIFLSQLFEHKMAVTGLGVILFFVIVSLSAPLIGKILNVDAVSQNVFSRYQPPMTTVSLGNSDQEINLERLIQAHPDTVTTLGPLLKDKNIGSPTATDEDRIFNLIELKAPSSPIAVLESLESSPARDRTLALFKTFSKTHILGTDELGRDVLMRLIYGARVSMGVGLLVAIVSALIGLIIGCLAGYFGGWVDSALSRLTDSMLALPTLPLLIIFAAIDLKKVPFLGDIFSTGSESIFKLVFVVCIFSWMPVARLVRGSTLSIKEREFILAARTLGANNRTIIISHIVPNVIAPLLVAVTLGVGETILWEAALSFLGLGIQPPTPSWGNILFNAQELVQAAPLLAVLPGLLIFITVISFNFLGDGIQDAIDPKAIKR